MANAGQFSSIMGDLIVAMTTYIKAIGNRTGPRQFLGFQLILDINMGNTHF